ncbi:hypothetical protein ACFVY1_00740 [Streptomyces sp. NPDC058293]|uniref:hypothetical protein n=1 Tax=Streptomyces sp. NPDC058293 TaxID=3346429 RepID=UPI0036E73CE2
MSARSRHTQLTRTKSDAEPSKRGRTYRPGTAPTTGASPGAGPSASTGPSASPSTGTGTGTGTGSDPAPTHTARRKNTGPEHPPARQPAKSRP